MPEGPEVRVVADFISRSIGRKFDRAEIVENTDKLHRFSKKPPKGLETLNESGFIIESVRARGKLIIIDFNTNDSRLSALVTLGMSGSWAENARHYKHARISFISNEFDLTFLDPRCFGTFKLVTTDEASSRLNKIGHDLLSSPMDSTAWMSLRSSKKIKDMPIGEALMEQKLFSGIGNIYKSEIIYRCYLDPRTPVRDIDDETWASINIAAHDILAASYINKGSTVSTFSSNGDHGSNQFFLKAYRKSSAPEGEIIALEQAGRVTWWCPNRTRTAIVK